MKTDRTHNAAAGLIDVNLRADRGDKAAFIDPQRTLSYSKLDEASRRMANLLRAHGLEREDRIALLAHDTVDWPVMFLGAIRAGVVPIALNTLLPTAQYAYMLCDSRAQALFVSAALLPSVEPLFNTLADLHNVFVLDSQSNSQGSSEENEHIDFASALAAQPSDFDTVATCRDEVAFWLYSSGSTGAPKGTQHVHSSMMDTALLYGRDVLGLREDDVVLSAAKLFFAYGLGNALSFPMAVGATTILWPARPTPAEMFNLLSQHQPSVFYGVPTLYAAMLAEPDCGPHRSSAKLRLCVSAGEALPKDVGERWQHLFGVDVIDGVGSTEMLHIYLSNAPGNVVYGTSGIAVPGYDVRLVDEHGSDVGVDEVGELLVRGTSAALGYWNQLAKSRQTFVGEWTRTGDKYTRNEESRYVYCGRTDDMFKVSGIWVSPFEVESALITHACVLEAAVVPFEDDDGLTKPRAIVVLTEGSNADSLFEELRDHVQNAIGTWKYPRRIDFVDSLPKTATGKIQRFKLRT
ncbi:MAG: 4-hydroxybenzoate-CoA ligase [Gammaproteobacteria bacterium]|jgi:4-hydroxybenzoate-CoA ligase